MWTDCIYLINKITYLLWCVILLPRKYSNLVVITDVDGLCNHIKTSLRGNDRLNTCPCTDTFNVKNMHGTDTFCIRTCPRFKSIATCKRKANLNKVFMAESILNRRMIKPVCSFSQNLNRYALTDSIVNTLPIQLNRLT